MKAICDGVYKITNQEWVALEEKFENLVHFASWQLLKKNLKNNHTDEEEDISQELRQAIFRAGCYYKRQVYIKACLSAVKIHAKDLVVTSVVEELDNLWNNRTRHGAGRQKFGKYQEDLLEQITEKYVPEADRPDQMKPLDVDNKFAIYAKSILWNSLKNLGKKITREKSWRSGLVSISQFEYLAHAE